MREVAILGAGALGGTLAHVLARRDVVSRIRLLDEANEIAAGMALDIMQASALEAFTTRVTGSSDLASMAGASVVVIADRPAGDLGTADGLLTLNTIARLAPSSVVVCAAAAHRELVERGVREAHFSRTRLFGSAPEALTAAVRAVVALETKGSARDVALSVLGIPPDRVVVLWEDAAVQGVSAVQLLDEPTRRRIRARVPRLWPPGPVSLAAAAAEAVAAIVGRSHRRLTCFVAPDDSNGRRARAVALPAQAGADGISIPELPPLAPASRTALDRALLL